MKIDRRNFLFASSAAALGHKYLPTVFGKSDPDRIEFEPKPAVAKQVTVYTTAEKSDLRLKQTDTVAFKSVGQPKETQICVFVDPGRQSQTFLGIGGALTDAAAETFAKLPKQKQREF